MEAVNIIKAKAINSRHFKVLCKGVHRSIVWNMAYLTDLFEKLIVLNTSLLGNQAAVISWNEKVKAFIKKFRVWQNQMESRLPQPDSVDIKVSWVCYRVIIHNFYKVNWIKSPFKNAPGPSCLDIKGQTQFKILPTLRHNVMKILTPFATTYLYQAGFLGLSSMKSNYHSRLNARKELQATVTTITSHLEKLSCQNQTNPSH
ncbi:uncharacterized protein LOC126161284 [Schistocerca cancellata]|uniref:uncharacterized protein LOC126161284 n=1 Tax=Schistocerca cancellata TaxID=274614 RepID=UPI0021182D89|nr:uncharacterized protein LOC126161284 [Schistocerca cancellata]